MTSALATASTLSDRTRCTYRIGSDDVIDVVRVLHQRMDADRHLD